MPGCLCDKISGQCRICIPIPGRVLKDKDGVNLANTRKISGDTVYVPYYNLHKVLAGLIDVTKNVDDQEIKETALSVAEGFGEYLNNRLSKLTDKNKMLPYRIWRNE